ncbi:MAG TPA: hypothetical protein V6D15_05180 [Oculatellaceae cyanobacterium]
MSVCQIICHLQNSNPRHSFNPLLVEMVVETLWFEMRRHGYDTFSIHP